MVDFSIIHWDWLELWLEWTTKLRNGKVQAKIIGISINNILHNLPAETKQVMHKTQTEQMFLHKLDINLKFLTDINYFVMKIFVENTR